MAMVEVLGKVEWLLKFVVILNTELKTFQISERHGQLQSLQTTVEKTESNLRIAMDTS